MKKRIYYTTIAIFYSICLITIFSFTSINTKNSQIAVKENMTPAAKENTPIENTTQSASSETPAAESEALTIIDNTSSTSGIPTNLPAGGYRPTKEIAARALYGVASYYANSFVGQQAS